jgi:hypothetical protein
MWDEFTAGFDRSGSTDREEPATGGPRVGEQRTINGQLAEWDGRGWLAVSGR